MDHGTECVTTYWDRLISCGPPQLPLVLVQLFTRHVVFWYLSGANFVIFVFSGLFDTGHPRTNSRIDYAAPILTAGSCTFTNGTSIVMAAFMGQRPAETDA